VNESLIGTTFNVFDNIGEIIISGKITSENTFVELSNLSKGIYVFRVCENLEQTFKVVKE
jgi:hypothetical protein